MTNIQQFCSYLDNRFFHKLRFLTDHHSRHICISNVPWSIITGEYPVKALKKDVLGSN